MPLNSMDDVLMHSLKDLLSAEKQFRDALPKLAKAASDEELKEAFMEHRDETVEQIERLEKIFELLGKTPRSEKCHAADGLTTEGEHIIEEGGSSAALDIMLTSAGRKVEHYEIASYEDAVSLAKQVGNKQVAKLLKQTLEQEQEAATKLEKIGQRLASENAVSA